MRTGKTYIDNLDIYAKYGVIVSEYSGAFGWPALKKPETVEYPEEDGIRAELSAPKLDSREIEITFTTVTDAANTGALLAQLGGIGYHTVNFAEIGISYLLRYIGQTEHQHTGKVRRITVRMADDKPLNGYTYAAPYVGPAVPEQGYQLDTYDFNRWGVRILDGTDISIEKAPEAKTGLLINEPSQSGAIWDNGQTVRYKEKTVSIKCLLYSVSPPQFWTNYQALLYDLTRPGARSLTSDTEETALPCYYDSANVSRFEQTDNGGIWCEFTIKLIVTSNKPESDLIVLASMKNEFIQSVNNELIDLSHDNN